MMVRDTALQDDSSADGFEVVQTQEAALDSKTLAAITSWLQPTDYEAESSEYNRHLSSRVPDTGLWICNTDQYAEWHTSVDRGSLWIKGVPGAGKSVTAASISKHLKLTENAPVLTFFFRYIVVANRTARGLVRDWLAQILLFSVQVQHSLQAMRDRELDDITDNQLWDCLLLGLSELDKVYCVADALDEMDMSADYGFLNRLNQLATFRPTHIKILMTSRPKQYLQRALPETSIVHISLEQGLVGRDIFRYIDSRLRACLGKKTASDSDLDDVWIKEATRLILERCGGLFLYARLLLDQILASLLIQELPHPSELVNGLPSGLESMYGNMLQQQAKSLGLQDGIQQLILEAVIHSARPLRLNELSHVLRCVHTHLTVTKAKEIARSACAPLLETSEDETVQVIHHSFTEYLLSQNQNREDLGNHDLTLGQQSPLLSPPLAHKRLMLICLDYLQSSLTNLSTHSRKLDPSGRLQAVSSETVDSADEGDSEEQLFFHQRKAQLEHPLPGYAAKNWAHHASKYDVADTAVFEAILRFLTPGNEAFLYWMRLEWRSRRSESKLPSALHVAAFAGLTKLATTLELAAIADNVDSQNRTALHWASRRGRSAFVALLLEHGAKPGLHDRDGLQPIHEAAKHGHAETVKLLIDAGASPLAPKACNDLGRRAIYDFERPTRGETPLKYAVVGGHLNVLETMTPYLRQTELEEALCRACKAGRADLVRFLLTSTDVSTNCTLRGGTPLVLAIQALDVASVELLLAHGADVNAISVWTPNRRIGPYRKPYPETPKTALHKLLKCWTPQKAAVCMTILKLLISAGADINALDGEKKSPLEVYRRASYRGRSTRTTFDRQIVRTLLDAGASFSDSKDDSMLCRCLEASSDTRILQDFIEYGARLDSRNRSGQTPLHVSLQFTGRQLAPSEDNVVNFLLSHGARWEEKDHRGTSAFAVAVRLCSDLDKLRSLFEQCTNMSVRQDCVWDIYGSSVEKQDYFGLLVDFGVSLEVRNTRGETPLLASIARSTKSTTDALLELGADTFSVDRRGRGLLHALVLASRNWDTKPDRFGNEKHISDFELWLSRGLDLQAVDYSGNSLLHELAASWRGVPDQVTLLEWLLDQGLGASRPNQQGLAPFQRYLTISNESRFGSSHIPRHDNPSPSVCLGNLLRPLQLGGFDLESRESSGLTTLLLTASRDSNEFAFLIDCGADIGARDYCNRTVLHIAVAAGHTNIVGQILSLTGDTLLNERDVEGQTPLYEACLGGHLETVGLLISRGASFVETIEVWDGKSALRACVDSKQESEIGPILDLLLDAGASATIGVRSELILDYAIRKRCKPVVRHLMARQEDFLAISNLPGIGAGDRKRAIMNYSEDDTKADFATWIDILCRAEASFRENNETTRNRILEEPIRYLDYISEPDIEHLTLLGAATLRKATSVSAGGFLHEIVRRGRIDLVRGLSGLAKELDDQDLLSAAMCDVDRSKWNSYKNFAPLVWAACQRDAPNLVMLKILVEELGLSVDSGVPAPHGFTSGKDTDIGKTALHELAKVHSWWQLEAIRYLAGKGAKIDVRDSDGRTPLHMACGENLGCRSPCAPKQDAEPWRLECIKLLLAHGADINTVDKAGYSVLHRATWSPKIMQFLLSQGAKVASGKQTHLFIAIRSGGSQTLQMLLAAGCDPNAIEPAKNGDLDHTDYLTSNRKTQPQSPLLCASIADGGWDWNVKPGCASMIQTLLENGADSYAILADGQTLLHYVFQHGVYSVVRAFWQQRAHIDLSKRDKQGRNVLHAACKASHKYSHWGSDRPAIVIDLLSTQGIDIRATDDDDKTALHHILDNPDADDERILEMLKHPVCKEIVNWTDKEGFTAVQYALRTLRPSAVLALIGLGATWMVPDTTGRTAMHHIASQSLRAITARHRSSPGEEEFAAHKQQCLDLWKNYLEQGGNIECRDNNGNTPLLTYLLSPATNIDQRHEHQQTRYSCHVDNYDRFFANADVFALNNAGETALHVIARRIPEERILYDSDGPSSVNQHDAALFEFFVKKGLDPLAEDGQGRTALDHAVANEQQVILELYQYRS